MSIALRIDCNGEQDFKLHIDCELPALGVTAIYGPSGSGKTTLLDCIAGLRKPSPDSTIRIGERCFLKPGLNTPAWKRRVGYVFSDARLMPHMSVGQNLQYAQQRAMTQNFSIQSVSQWLNIEDLLPRRPETLSAGQQQRVAIARALMSSPQLLLLDEPFGNLDARSATDCLQVLRRISHDTQLPILFVSHDIEEVGQLADYVVLLGKGRVTEHGPLLQLSGKLDTKLSDNERAAAIVEGTVTGRDTHYALTEVTLENEKLLITSVANPPHTRLRVRIPARDVSICRSPPSDSSILNVLPVTISEMDSTESSRVMLRLSLGKQFLLARITLKSADTLNLKVGDHVFAQVKSAALLNTGIEHT